MDSCKCRICNKVIKHPESAILAAADAGWAPEAIDWASDEYIDGPFCTDCQDEYMEIDEETSEITLQYPLLRAMEMALMRK